MPVVPAGDRSKFERLDFLLQKPTWCVVLVCVFSQLLLYHLLDSPTGETVLREVQASGSMVVFPWVPLLILVCSSSDTRALLSRRWRGTVSSYDPLSPSLRTPSLLASCYSSFGLFRSQCLWMLWVFAGPAAPPARRGAARAPIRIRSRQMQKEEEELGFVLLSYSLWAF